MLTSIAANHAKGKSAEDTIFAANAACVAAAKKIGAENVTNATIGAILDEDEKLVCLPTVDKVFRSLSTDELIAYAPISGLPDYLEEVLNAAFGDSRPEGYMAAVATPLCSPYSTARGCITPAPRRASSSISAKVISSSLRALGTMRGSAV